VDDRPVGLAALVLTVPIEDAVVEHHPATVRLYDAAVDVEPDRAGPDGRACGQGQEGRGAARWSI
jgi:hypothetical protein